MQQVGTVHPVLVVDDDPSLRRLLAVTLGAAGLQVVEAGRGEDALDLARTRPFSLVLLDNHMPGMSGLDVLAELRSSDATRRLPVIMVTGEDEVSARVRGLHEGADDYVIKPFHPDELVARVKAQMRGQAAWAELLERQLAERAAIAGALCRMHPQTTPERAADVLCEEVRLLRGLSGTALIVFAGDGAAVPLAVKGAGAGLLPGIPLPPSTAARLRDRAGDGPWVDRGADRVAWAPFGTGDPPLGLLALAAGDHNGNGSADDAQLLAAAIDFAAVATGLVTPSLLANGDHDARRAQLSELLSRRAFTPVFQPIVNLADGEVIGFEALTRFTDGSPPQRRFAEAAALERGVELETATLEAALAAAGGLPPGCWVSVNVSPSLVLEGQALHRLLGDCRLPVVLEITEHDPVDDYGQLSAALDQLRPAARLSVDDAGSGFASLRHVLALAPDFVKLDQSWVTGIADDPARQALVAGLCHFAGTTGSLLIAEGIETDPERGMLTALDVDLGQGFLFGRPCSVPAA